MMTLRGATPQDIETLTAVIRASFEEYQGKLDPPSGAHAENGDAIREKMEKGGAILTFVDEVCAGGVLFSLQDDFLYLGRLAVLPAYRQQGIGQALTAAVEQKALTMGFEAVQLGVRIALPRNRAFFERLGYRVVAYHSHPGYSEPTFITLEKRLSI
jgi:predicted N-acetyltransferase YhbS